MQNGDTFENSRSVKRSQSSVIKSIHRIENGFAKRCVDVFTGVRYVY